MKVGIIQSNYIPWRGYFDFIDGVDRFILLDDVAIGGGSNWRTRNRLRFKNGLRWLTVPVHSTMTMPIDEVTIAGDEWIERHGTLILESLGTAPWFEDVHALWTAAVRRGHDRLSALNESLIRSICDHLAIRTEILRSRDLAVEGTKTDRVIGLLRRVGATSYLSGPAARDYIDEQAFRDAGISLLYKSYDYAPYPQVGEGFEPAVSVLDLIANTGPEARTLIRSRTPDEVAVE